MFGLKYCGVLLRYSIVKVYSNYVNFKILIELVLRGPDDDGDFGVRSCPQSAFLVFDTDSSQQGRRDGGA